MRVIIDGKLVECESFRVVEDEDDPEPGKRKVHVRQFDHGTQGLTYLRETLTCDVYRVVQPDFGMRTCADFPITMETCYWVLYKREAWPVRYDTHNHCWTLQLPCPTTLKTFRDKQASAICDGLAALRRLAVGNKHEQKQS